MKSLVLTEDALVAWEAAISSAPAFSGLRAVKQEDLRALVHDARAAHELSRLINTPELVDFPKAVHLEAVHQEQRWGTADRRGKGPYEWYWLLSHLATRALDHHREAERLRGVRDLEAVEEGAPVLGEIDSQIGYHREKAVHHTITAAAVLAHWHASVIGAHTAMQPGHSASAAEAAELLGEGR